MPKLATASTKRKAGGSDPLRRRLIQMRQGRDEKLKGNRPACHDQHPRQLTDQLSVEARANGLEYEKQRQQQKADAHAP
jgi:hypothetical protein